MFIEIILLSFVVAYFRGGRLKQLPSFQKLYFLIISILLQVFSGFIPVMANILISISYLFMLCFFFFNREYEEFRIFMIGWFLNSLVIWSNFGRMPVDLEQAKKTPYPIEPLLQGTDYKHVLLTGSTHFSFLGDIMYMPFPIPRIISVGDLFIMLGAILLVQRIMNKPISLLKLREGKLRETK